MPWGNWGPCGCCQQASSTLLIIQAYGEGGVVFPGATVTAKKGGLVAFTGTTDSTGRCQVPVTPAPDQWSITVTATGKTTFQTPLAVQFIANTTTTWQCLMYATATTITVHDATWGAFTLTWDSGNLWWFGKRNRAFTTTAGCGCGAVGGVTIGFRMQHAPGLRLDVFYSANNPPTDNCPAFDGGLYTDYIRMTAGTQQFQPSLSLPSSLPAGSQPIYCAAAASATVTQP